MVFQKCINKDHYLKVVVEIDLKYKGVLMMDFVCLLEFVPNISGILVVCSIF